MNTYEQKQAAKRERLEAAADRADTRSNAAYGRADLREEASGIVFGQPILVGHHSEGRHRAAIKRADNAMRKSIDESKRADQLRAKAEAVGTGGISSDDPDAIKKLQAELAQCEDVQKFMVAVNKALKKVLKKHSPETPEARAELAALIEPLKVGKGDLYAETILKPDCMGRFGFPSFQTSNNSANMRRIKKRIAALEEKSKLHTAQIAIGDICIRKDNVEANRVQFIFDGKPSEAIRKILKSHGFRWAPSQGAWQRQLTGNAQYAAQRVARELLAD